MGLKKTMSFGKAQDATVASAVKVDCFACTTNLLPREALQMTNAVVFLVLCGQFFIALTCINQILLTIF